MGDWTLRMRSMSCLFHHPSLRWGKADGSVLYCRQLTRTTLRKDFGLRIELPDDRLCPPVCMSEILMSCEDG